VPTGATARPNDELGPRRSIPLADAYAPHDPDRPAPFAWQDGRRLWILDGKPDDWVLAELVFEPQTCRYLEVRRSNYRWPREAAGVFLARTFAGGQRRAEDAARGLSEWVSRSESALRFRALR
jgi:hypothetical protein